LRLPPSGRLHGKRLWEKMKDDEYFMVNGTVQVNGMRKGKETIPVDIHGKFFNFLNTNC
jgi:hypothetical protein